MTGHARRGAGAARGHPLAYRVPAAPVVLLTILLLLACAISTGATAQELLRVTLGEGEGSAARFSSRPAISVTTVDGARVILKQASGKDYSVEAGQRTWSWFQVQQVPAQETYIAVTPRVQGQSVTLEITLAEKVGDRFTSLETTASGSLGEWIELAGGPLGEAQKGGRQYSSSGQPHRRAIRIDKVR